MSKKTKKRNFSFTVLHDNINYTCEVNIVRAGRIENCFPNAVLRYTITATDTQSFEKRKILSLKKQEKKPKQIFSLNNLSDHEVVITQTKHPLDRAILMKIRRTGYVIDETLEKILTEEILNLVHNIRQEYNIVNRRLSYL